MKPRILKVGRYWYVDYLRQGHRAPTMDGCLNWLHAVALLTSLYEQGRVAR